MRNKLRIFMAYLLFAALLALIPIGIARHMLSVSREDAFVPDKPNYLAHQYPPKGKAELTAKLSQLLDKDMHEMEDVPRVYLTRLPDILPNIPNANEKKRLFMSAMLPIILRSNELIIADRGRLLTLRDKIEQKNDLSGAENDWLAKTAKKYRVKLDKMPSVQSIDALLYKIDVVPVSLAIAQAAIETGWGTSKFAQQCNALFGQWTWDQNDDGCVPGAREEGKTHRIKKFNYLLDSVSSYMTNLNRHASYAELRRRRAELREHSLILTGAALAPALLEYSERGTDYVNDLLSIINYNELGGLDNAALATNSTS
ncbi:glucosaminidase domain-containing protein [Kordiimonas laminariae]|uniref:glucosaminidase domain-containing protein n=1 Tax=Kordiimonas laminariae TaxID=2917717 RepID=UPI001FF510F2|nr:glucosaminidase domain-containing protein [Kordiimonas laminariae]